jgi:hypothetical protein
MMAPERHAGRSGVPCCVRGLEISHVVYFGLLLHQATAATAATAAMAITVRVILVLAPPGFALRSALQKKDAQFLRHCFTKLL